MPASSMYCKSAECTGMPFALRINLFTAQAALKKDSGFLNFISFAVSRDDASFSEKGLSRSLKSKHDRNSLKKVIL